MRNLSSDEVANLKWRDLKSDPPPNEQQVYSRRSGETGYNSGTRYHAKSGKLYTITKHRNRMDITIWHSDQWAYHPDIEPMMERAARLASLRKRAGNLGWEIANCQAYGIHFPQKWNDDLRIMKAQIRMLENEP